ncbi:TIGR04338 family metallohydrolase [Mycobacteroides sp. LB1]|uniref:TIGR04338 family metallohydrolase n=1 Tax=Mycobacteroides sp. LB1 TaxID=2750814 RepID=UPI0015DDAE65|nr:TIGR04338 family metallohydrolase [Mycobacteroides sp. LB1]
MSDRPRDTQRAKVYAAEEFVRAIFERAASHSRRDIDFFGANLTLPPEARFASVESVQRYVDDVLALVGSRWSAGPLTVRARRGAAAAHYERDGDRAAIAVPDDRNGSVWAMRELVILHELAHHLCPQDVPAHGHEFVALYPELAGLAMGPEVEFILRTVYAREGVR